MPKALHSKTLLIILFVLACLTVIYFYRQLINERNLKKEYDNLLLKIEQLKKENAVISDEIERLKNEEELERLARELYVLKKPGEKTMVVPQEIMQQLKEEKPIPTPTPSFLQKIFSPIQDFFKDLF
jgi:cell division protein FtsB